MSFDAPSQEEHLASLDVFKSIMERGLTLHRQPRLFPTLVIETEDEIRMTVLDPAPELEETFEVVMQWKQAVLEDRENTQLHCVGFISQPNEIALGVFPPVNGTWLAGRIDAATGMVEWSPNPKVS